MTAETLEQFLARGGAIERIPPGVCNWDELTQRAKINPTVRPDEMAAKRAQKVTVPFREKPAQRPKRARPGKPFSIVRRPKAKKPPKPPKAPKEPVFARPGSKKARVVETLGPDWTTTAALSQRTGVQQHHVREYLRQMVSRGMAEGCGPDHFRHWRKLEGERPPEPVQPPRQPVGHLACAVMAELKGGNDTARGIAAATGQALGCVRKRLFRLKRAGLATVEGSTHRARWRPL